MAHEFKIEREVVLPATPEQVFAAVTTGTAGWLFPTPPIVDGDAPEGSTITAWDPPNHVAVRTDGPDGWFNALENIIESRDGGTASVRYVHSGIFVDDWDNQYDGAAKHTDFYLHSLGQYLRYFDGKPVTYVAVEGPTASGAPDAIAILTKALGLSEAAAVGDSVRIELPGQAPIEAEVDYINPYFVGLRGDKALYRFYGRNHFGGTVDAAHHYFSDIDPEPAENAWQSWLDGVYA